MNLFSQFSNFAVSQFPHEPLFICLFVYAFMRLTEIPLHKQGLASLHISKYLTLHNF